MSQIPAFYFQDILFYLTIIPLIGTLIMIFINPEKQRLLKILALNFSALPFVGFLFVWGGFKKSIGTFQFAKLANFSKFSENTIIHHRESCPKDTRPTFSF